MQMYLISIAAVWIAVIIWSPLCFSLSLLGLLSLGVISIGVLGVVWVHILLSSPHRTGDGVEQVHKELQVFRGKIMNDFELNQVLKHQEKHLPVIFGRTIDSLLQQLIDYIIRDFIYFYLKDYAYEPNLIGDNIKEDLWSAIQVFMERLSRVDHDKLIACDLIGRITFHFERLRDARSLVAETDHLPPFVLSPHLVSEEKELNYLRDLSEILIMFLLPRSYSLSPAKYFVREILACKVLYPFIDTITDPDYFNQNVVAYIESQKVKAAMHRKTFEYANSFEEFLKILQKTNDVEVLKRIRYDIVTKLMQATTLQNMNRAKGLDPDGDKNSGINKSDMNAAKKLQRYVNQLTYAKKLCEQRLSNLGSDVAFYTQSETQKILPLATILEHVLGRKYFSQFLDNAASHNLIRYWTAVEELRIAPRKNWHQLGAEIFYTYIRSPGAEIKVDKNTRKKMEAFLLGDKGPEVFYEVQSVVVQILEDKYYQSFITSDFYKEMLAAIANEDGPSEIDCNRSRLEKPNSENDNAVYMEKLDNKMQALQALRSSLKPESRVLRILENEVEWLGGEKRQLEAHISRTETWGENLGKWRAIVQSAEIPDEKDPPLFILVVHVLENDNNEEDEGISTGWVVSRTLTQFQELHRKLRPLCSTVKNLELPSQSFKFLFGKLDKNSLEKARCQIQKYLEFVLEDDRLNQSEAIYSFLSPSSDHLKYTTPSPKKTKFSFSTLFKSGSGEQGSKETNSLLRESEEEDISQILNAPGGVDVAEIKTNGTCKILDDTRDMIAEPLYALMSEIFDMRGVFKYLRKTLIAFVQVTYGRTINRQIRDTISWCFSEQMLHYYVSLIIRSWWPSEVLVSPTSERCLELQRQTEKEAREQFVSNVPEILVTLVGASAAKNGARKVFDTLQNKYLNKQLFYDLLEVSMSELFPELKYQDF